MLNGNQRKCVEEPTTKAKKPFFKRTFFQVYKSYTLVLLSALLLSINSTIVKSVYNMTAADLLLSRNVGLFVLNLPFLIKSQSAVVFDTPHEVRLVARGTFVFLGQYLLFVAAKLMPISDYSVIVSTSSIWMILLSSIIFGQRLDLLNLTSVAISMIGLVLMSKVFLFVFHSPVPKFSNPGYWYGCVSSLLSAISSAISCFYARQLKDVNDTVVIAYQSLIGIVGPAFVMFIAKSFSVPGCGFDGFKVMFLGFSAIVEHTAFKLAMKCDKAGPVVIVRVSSYIFYSFVFQITVFKKEPDFYTILAAVCIFCSLWLLGLRTLCQQNLKKRRKGRKERRESQV